MCSTIKGNYRISPCIVFLNEETPLSFAFFTSLLHVGCGGPQWHRFNFNIVLSPGNSHSQNDADKMLIKDFCRGWSPSERKDVPCREQTNLQNSALLIRSYLFLHFLSEAILGGQHAFHETNGSWGSLDFVTFSHWWQLATFLLSQAPNSKIWWDRKFCSCQSRCRLSESIAIHVPPLTTPLLQIPALQAGAVASSARGEIAGRNKESLVHPQFWSHIYIYNIWKQLGFWFIPLSKSSLLFRHVWYLLESRDSSPVIRFRISSHVRRSWLLQHM